MATSLHKLLNYKAYNYEIDYIKVAKTPNIVISSTSKKYYVTDCLFLFFMHGS
jgi:hypothetical protein